MKNKKPKKIFYCIEENCHNRVSKENGKCLHCAGLTKNHKSNCQCCACQAKRGVYKGKNNGMHGKHQSEEAREKIRKGNIEHVKLHGSYERTEEHRKKMGKVKELQWKEPEFRKKAIEANLARWTDELRQKHSVICSKEGNGMYGKKRSVESIQKQLKSWDKNKDKNISNMLASICKRPNKFEANALLYLNSIYDNKFQYTGDGSFIVNHRSADAYSEELKTVALFNGIYWHLKRYGFKNTEQAKGAIELIESIPFLEAGYKVIFIWEDELYSDNNIKHILKTITKS